MKLVLILFLLITNTYASDNSLKLLFIKSSHVKILEKGQLQGAPAEWKKIIKVDEHCLWAQIPFKKRKGVLGLSSCSSIPVKSYGKVSFRTLAVLKQGDQILLEMDTQGIQLRLPDNSNIETVATRKRFKPTLKIEMNTLFCKRWSKGCRLEVDNCQQCPNGKTASATSNCQGKIDYYCIQNECGKRNALACRRGSIYSELEALKGCQNAGVEGYCEEGLELFCENSQLYCR